LQQKGKAASNKGGGIPASLSAEGNENYSVLRVTTTNRRRNRNVAHSLSLNFSSMDPDDQTKQFIEHIPSLFILSKIIKDINSSTQLQAKIGSYSATLIISNLMLCCRQFW